MIGKRILFIGDLHLNARQRDRYRHDFLSEILRVAEELQPDLIVLVGDLTDEKDGHSAWLVNQIATFVAELAAIADVVVDKGNHDYLDEDMPFFLFLREIPGVRYVNKPTEIMGILFLPHTNDYEHDWAQFIDRNWEPYDLVVAHNTFEGAKGENGRELRGIPLDIFPDDITIVAGDVHVPQKIAGGKLIYVGAPYTVRFGDSFEPRLLYGPLSSNSSHFESIPCEGPQKRLVEATAGQALPKNFWDDNNIHKGDILKVRVNLEMKHLDKWPELRREIRAWGDKHGMVIDSVQPVTMFDLRRSKELATQPRASDAALVDTYGKRQGIGKSILKAGHEFLK